MEHLFRVGHPIMESRLHRLAYQLQFAETARCRRRKTYRLNLAGEKPLPTRQLRVCPSGVLAARQTQKGQADWH